MVDLPLWNITLLGNKKISNLLLKRVYDRLGEIFAFIMRQILMNSYSIKKAHSNIRNKIKTSIDLWGIYEGKPITV